jgi:hypothetical protein
MAWLGFFRGSGFQEILLHVASVMGLLPAGLGFFYISVTVTLSAVVFNV